MVKENCQENDDRDWHPKQPEKNSETHVDAPFKPVLKTNSRGPTSGGNTKKSDGPVGELAIAGVVCVASRPKVNDAEAGRFPLNGKVRPIAS